MRADELKNEQEQEPLLNTETVPIHPLRLCKEIRDFVDEDAIIIGDGGDGTFGLSGMEFDTMVRLKLPIVCVIGNDAKWGQVKAYYQLSERTPVAVDLSPLARYDKTVVALGGYAELVEEPEEIRPALTRAFACGRPACLNVITALDVFYGVRSYKVYK